MAGRRTFQKLYAASHEVKAIDCRILITGSTGLPISSSLTGQGIASVVALTTSSFRLAFGDKNATLSEPELALRDRYSGGLLSSQFTIVQSGSLLQGAASARAGNFMVTRDDLAASGTIDVAHRVSGSTNDTAITQNTYLRGFFFVKVRE